MTPAGNVWTLERGEADVTPSESAQRSVGEIGADGIDHRGARDEVPGHEFPVSG